MATSLPFYKKKNKKIRYLLPNQFSKISLLIFEVKFYTICMESQTTCVFIFLCLKHIEIEINGFAISEVNVCDA